MSSTATLPEPVQTSLGFRGRWLPQTDPGSLTGESWVAPGGGAGPLHRHLRQEERFDVLEGAITVRLGRRAHVVRAGESFTIPAGAAHTFANHTDAEAHFTATFTPPGDVMGVFEALQEAGGTFTLRQAAAAMAAFRADFFYLARVPVRAQRALGWLARRLPRA